MPLEELPRLDEHSVTVAAPPGAVWDAVLATLAGAFSPAPARWAARALGCDPQGYSGWGTAEVGSSVPGFRVVRAERPGLLVVAGRHRFSRYGIVFRLEPAGDRTRCSAESRAAFPGLQGALYRAGLLATGGHVLGVRHLLHGIRRAAERPTRGTAAPPAGRRPPR